MEKPKINRIFTKEECLLNPDVKQSIVSDFEKEKIILPMVLPMVEAAVKKSRHIHTLLYREKLLAEIEQFKKDINFNDIKAEIDADIQMMKRDPKKLDEKFGIVRDRYGREISRNGIPNPYYISPEQADADEAYFQSIKNDKEKLKAYFNQMCQKSIDRMEKEESELTIRAKARLEEILQNPTTNYYASYGLSSKTSSSNERTK